MRGDAIGDFDEVIAAIAQEYGRDDHHPRPAFPESIRPEDRYLLNLLPHPLDHLPDPRLDPVEEPPNRGVRE